MSTATDTVDIGAMITRTPGIKGGTPHIAGTGVTVRTIVRWYKIGLSPEEIAAEYPHVGLGAVYAAMAYYHANREAMETEMAAEEAESDKIEHEFLRGAGCTPLGSNPIGLIGVGSFRDRTFPSANKCVVCCG